MNFVPNLGSNNQRLLDKKTLAVFDNEFLEGDDLEEFEYEEDEYDEEAD